MPKSKGAPSRPLVFLDASVLIAAALSPSGGSFRLIHEGSRAGFTLITSLYAMHESLRNLQRKYPDRAALLVELVALGKIEKVRDATEAEVGRAANHIEYKDAPILAGALAAKATYLITLDREHFFTQKLLGVKLGITILLPGDFLRQYFAH